MNEEILHELIARYEDGLDWIDGPVHDELFKWRAMATWRREWFKPKDAFANFAERFKAARRDFGLMIDTGRMHPSSGVIKLWEREPDAVEHLFLDVLFAETGGDISSAQAQMDAFIDDYEALRQKVYPGNWSFKQDRHSASVFLAMHDPALHFIYKSSEANMMAQYTSFGADIGTGKSFHLAHYYALCEAIIAAFKTHESLLEKHFAKLDARCYRDESLHLLVFDLMYCCRTYGLYNGLPLPVTARTAKKSPAARTDIAAGDPRKEERQAKAMALQRELTALLSVPDECEDISLIGIRVRQPLYGEGTVVSQEANRIDVQFPGIKKRFVLSRDHSSRPRFEGDEEIIDALTSYGERMEKIKKLKEKLAILA